jgi:ABC-type dipeptide/oligopeptide/nickel transport system permease subunit
MSALGILLYVVMYASLAPWWRTVVGRAMFSLGAVILAITSLAALGQIFGTDYAARPIFRLLTWLATAGVVIGLLIALIRVQLGRKQ